MRPSQMGDETNRNLNYKFVLEDTTPQHPGVNWTKIVALLCFTYGFIAVMWAISNAIQHMKGDMYQSFTDAGGLILGFFLFYVVCFGVAWFCGYGKRDQMRRDAVEKAVARQNALQAMVVLQ